jgi:hypothetical protein
MNLICICNSVDYKCFTKESLLINQSMLKLFRKMILNHSAWHLQARQVGICWLSPLDTIMPRLNGVVFGWLVCWLVG